jgi:hypothetical protein
MIFVWHIVKVFHLLEVQGQIQEFFKGVGKRTPLSGSTIEVLHVYNKCFGILEFKQKGTSGKEIICHCALQILS